MEEVVGIRPPRSPSGASLRASGLLSRRRAVLPFLLAMSLTLLWTTGPNKLHGPATSRAGTVLDTVRMPTFVF